MYNRIITTFSEVFLNVDCFKARIFQSIALCKNVLVFVKGMLSEWVYNATVIRAELNFTSFIIVDATRVSCHTSMGKSNNKI